MVNAVEFSKQGEKYLGTPYSVMDCQAFVERMLRDAGLSRNWAGSNAMYRDMAWVGTPEECRERFGLIPVGAWLFILEQNGRAPAKYRADGIGNASHVGVKTGVGKGAIHSSASRGQVAESVFKDKTIRGGWNRVGLPDFLDFGVILNTKLKVSQQVEQVQNAVAQEPDVAPDASVSEPETAVVVTPNMGPLNIRAKPTKKCPLYWQAPNGAEVEVLDRNTGASGWYKVRYGKVVGYAMSEYLQNG